MNMINRRTPVILLLALLALPGVGLSAEQRTDEQVTIDRRDTFDDMVAELGLSKTQRDGFNRARAAHVEKMKDIKSRIDEKYKTIAQELLKDKEKQDKELTDGLQLEIEDLRIKYMDERLALMNDIRGLLTAKQLTELDKLNLSKQRGMNRRRTE